jgi:RimJ/RimL family protein N-acetyltransferase
MTPEQIRERIVKNRTCFEDNGFADFAVVELETGEFVGRAGFGLFEDGEIEVGYVFLKHHWGRGLAVPRIVAYAPKQHSASFNVMRKSGMRYFKTGTVRGVECDLYEYSLP